MKSLLCASLILSLVPRAPSIESVNRTLERRLKKADTERQKKMAEMLKMKEKR